MMVGGSWSVISGSSGSCCRQQARKDLQGAARPLARAARSETSGQDGASDALGCTEELSLEEARLRAEDILRQIKLGIDPNAPPEAEKCEGWTIEQLYDEYAADMKRRDCSERTIDRLLYRRDLYLADWLSMPLTELTRTIVRAKHHDLSENRGPTTANQVMREFRAAYNSGSARRRRRRYAADNPVKAVTFNKERRKNAVIEPQTCPTGGTR